MAKSTLNLNGPSLKLPSSITKTSFDYVARYQLIAEIITQYFKGKKPKNILDVGGLGTFLDKVIDIPLTILDEEATDHGSSEKRGDGARMNVEDGAYDAVVTSDTLEHIPAKDRANFISELVRVSNDLIILCAPFADNGAAAEEAKLQKFYTGLTGQPHRWLKEHAEYGIPKIKDIEGYFKKAGVKPVVFGHSSIKLWRELMGINLLSNDMGHPDIAKKTAAINNFYNQKIMFNDFAQDSYRMFFVASKKQDLTVKFSTQSPSVDAIFELLNLTNDFYSTALVEAEYVPKLRKRVENLHNETIRLANQVQDITGRYDHLMHSRSWRYTAPMRQVEKTIRKVNTKGAK